MGGQTSTVQQSDAQEDDSKGGITRASRPRGPKQLDFSLEKLPTEVILRIVQFLPVSHISIAFTCPRMYEIFKDVRPQPISLCNAGVAPHLDPSSTETVHLKLLEYAWILRVYEPKDYVYKVLTRVCQSAPDDGIPYRYQYYGRFLRRPYYSDERNCRDLKQRYRNYELYTQCWSQRMPKEFPYPHPYNKGRFTYEMEMKEAIHELLDSMDDATPEEYRERMFFMWKFLAIGSNAEVKGLVIANLSLKHFAQWREMIEF
ncbi:hypothetical protein OCU04_003470 [Sclerotinia nivalis]|uniref:F-box domain-containing protein n=1 Tax=Sclerotinia nivalis TaxID=352851 RepID=A0A9X0ASU2_9HELO|nr:hypothetical protein OCU04_003470 [Sclerotinia nivalis]